MTSYLYASNVFHYLHVLKAMQAITEDVTLIRRMEITPTTLKTIERLPVPKKVSHIVGRRAVERTVHARAEVVFGPEHFVIPASHMVGRRITRSEYRAITTRMAQKVASHSHNKAVVQFVEGLGHRALRQRGDNTRYICERRGNHPASWANPRHIHLEMPHTFKNDPILEYLEEEFAMSDNILVYSDFAKSTFTEQGVDPNKIMVAPLPLPPLGTPLPRRVDTKAFLFVGRGVVDKGLDVAVAAIRELALTHRDARLLVAGPMSPEVRTWLEQFPCVQYLGTQSKDGLRELYSQTVATVIPSTESFGFALLEAIHYGAPALCSTQTGAAAYVRSNLLKIVDGFDPSDWANQMHRLLDLPGQNDATGSHMTNDPFPLLRPAAVLEQWTKLYENKATSQ